MQEGLYEEMRRREEAGGGKGDRVVIYMPMVGEALVAMLACAGFLVQEKVHTLFSGDGGPAIDQIPQLPVWLWAVMTAGIGAAAALRDHALLLISMESHHLFFA